MRISRYAGKNLVTRKKLREIMDNRRYKVIDFQGVSFISRSVADEFIKLKKERDFEIKNTSKDVQEMLDHVKKSKPKPNPDIEHIRKEIEEKKVIEI